MGYTFTLLQVGMSKEVLRPRSLIPALEGKMSQMEERFELVRKTSSSNGNNVVVIEADQEKQSPLKSTHLIEYHRAFFFMGYYLGIVPYRLVRDDRDGLYILKGSRAQSVICVIVQGFICYEYFSTVRSLSWNSIDGTPMSYLHVATIFASLLYVMFFVYVFWAKADLMRKMFTELQTLQFARPSQDRYIMHKTRMLSIAFCTFAACVASTDLMIHDGLFINETFGGTYKKLACRAKSFYLFQECPLDVPSSALPDNQGFLETFVTILHLIILPPNLVMVHTVDVVVVLTAICMWHVLKYFINHSKEDTTSAATAMVHYEALKCLVIKMNAAVGLLTFSAIAVSLPFYASWGAIVFNDTSIDWLYLIHVSTYFINFFTILTFGADFNFKVGEFYGRITAPEVSDSMPPNRLTALLMDMHSNQISMRGCGFFVMTYRFFGTILSLIVTYSIIILQFQFSRRSLSQVNCTYVEAIQSHFSVVNGNNRTA